MSDFKNKLIEKYTEYFILNNPSYNKDDQATTDFCNEKLEQYYVPYINYIETKRKMSKDKEVELENIKANTSVSYRERLFKIGFLCSMSIFSERPSLKTYTDELKGFDERYFMYMEDVDICRKIDLSGKRKLYFPATEIIHSHRKGSSKELRLFCIHISSIIKYFMKWGFNNA